jgi:hypothetical protein
MVYLMAYVKGMDIHDQIESLIRLIRSEPDPAVRLNHVKLALRASGTALRALRDESAYQARLHYSTVDLEAATGVHHSTLTEWCHRHADLLGLPMPRSRPRRDLSSAWDLSGLPADRQEAVRKRLQEAASGPGQPLPSSSGDATPTTA